MSPICPVCGRDEDVKSVPGIVLTGTRTTITSGPVFVPRRDQVLPDIGHARQYGTEQTELANLLSPPLEPRKPSKFPWHYVMLALLILLLLGVCGCVSPCIYLSVAINYYPEDFPILGYAVPWIAAGFPILVAILLAPLGYFGLVRPMGKTVERDYEEKHIRWEKQHKKWENACLQWEQAWYCHKDFLVFWPETDKTCDPRDFHHHLYSLD